MQDLSTQDICWKKHSSTDKRYSPWPYRK